MPRIARHKRKSRGDGHLPEENRFVDGNGGLIAGLLSA